MIWVRDDGGWDRGGGSHHRWTWLPLGKVGKRQKHFIADWSCCCWERGAAISRDGGSRGCGRFAGLTVRGEQVLCCTGHPGEDVE